MRALIKIVLLLLSFVASTRILYAIIGLFNRKFKFINSLFICYAGNQRYARHYGFKVFEFMHLWNPNPIGIFRQGGSWGVVFAIAATEEAIFNKSNRQYLLKMAKRTNAIASLMGVDQVNYAGVLPSLLFNIGALPDDRHNDKAGLIVSRAYQRLSQDIYGALVPVILFGGAGSVGKYIHHYLDKLNVAVHVVDPAIGIIDMPESLQGHNAIVIDAARKSVLRQYKDQFWTELTILNETFPEPSRQLLSELSDCGLSVYHLSGVSGTCLPSLPFGYRDSIPCCAIHDLTQGIEPVVVELTKARQLKSAKREAPNEIIGNHGKTMNLLNSLRQPNIEPADKALIGVD